MTTEPNPTARVTVTGAVTVITLDRPDHRNSIDLATCTELTRQLGTADADRSVRAIVITGTERDFCTGADVTGRPDSAAGPARSTTAP